MSNDDLEYIREIYSQFSKPEILDISRQLGLKFEVGMNTRVLIRKILEDIDNTGVPDIDECSDLMFEFLIVAEYVDEEGNYIEYEEEYDDEIEEEEVHVSEKEEIEVNVDELPECFSLADERDPACQRCRVFEECYKVRIKNRPPCFGRLFSEHAEECKVCIEAPFCRKELEKSNKEKSHA